MASNQPCDKRKAGPGPGPLSNPMGRGLKPARGENGVKIVERHRGEDREKQHRYPKAGVTNMVSFHPSPPFAWAILPWRRHRQAPPQSQHTRNGPPKMPQERRSRPKTAPDTCLLRPPAACRLPTPTSFLGNAAPLAADTEQIVGLT